VGNQGYLDPVFGLARGFGRYERWGMQKVDGLARSAAEVVARKRRKPLFLFLNVIDAHEPYEAPPPYDRLFAASDLDVAPVAADPWRPPDAQERARRIAQYDGELRFIDDHLKTVFDELRRRRRWDDALVIVTSDHGELFGEHGRWGHTGEPTRALVHVPLIVKYPRGTRRGVEDRPVSLAAVPATVLEVVGLPPLGAGRRPLWEPAGPAVAENIRPDGVTRAAFDGDDRMLLDVETGGRRETFLFDLRSDADGTRPRAVASDPAGARLEAELRNQVAGWAAPRPGPVVFPRSDRKLAERLRALGYLR
jgi:hypothetical protein